MPNETEVDHVDALCTGLLRAGRAPSRSSDSLFYSSVIAESVEQLLPKVEEACAQWPAAYPERAAAERLIAQTREALERMRELLEANPAPPATGALYPGRPVAVAAVPRQGSSAEQLCEQLARAQQALRRHLITLAKPRKAAER